MLFQFGLLPGKRVNLLGADAAIDLLQFLQARNFMFQVGPHFDAGFGHEARDPAAGEDPTAPEGATR